MAITKKRNPYGTRKYKSVDDYFSDQPEPTVTRLNEMRGIIKAAAPEAEELISYNMPAYKLKGMLVYYAGYKNHIGFYPAGSVKQFTDKLKGYKTSKGTIQFPVGKMIPVSLVKAIVKARVQENREKQDTRKKVSTTNLSWAREIQVYNNAQTTENRRICNLLAGEICRCLPEAENKIWHAHPVWFLNGNPIVGYSKLKNCIRLLFWSGQSFDEPALQHEGSFKAAEIRYTAAGQINKSELSRWLKKAKDIQWDYKNIVKRKGKLVRLL
jgi:uncharacterized protein YdhG (YjbR/CyaY superfamily)